MSKNVEMITLTKDKEELNCPERYKERLFLKPADIMDLLEIGESLAYAYLKNPPFRTEKVGGKIVIFANSFWRWYYTGTCS